VNLAFKLSGTQAIVYRKPWGVIAFSIIMTAILLVGASGFGLISSREAKSVVAIPFAIFGLIFGIFGLLMIQEIVRKSGTWLRDGGIPLATASKSGLIMATSYNAKPQTFDWSAVTAIVLADELETISNHETDWNSGQFIVFLNPDATPNTIMGRLTAQISRSGEDKPYLSTDFPPNSSRDLEMALRRLAPGSVLIRRCKRAIFDAKSKTDRYENT